MLLTASQGPSHADSTEQDPVARQPGPQGPATEAVWRTSLHRVGALTAVRVLGDPVQGSDDLHAQPLRWSAHTSHGDRSHRDRPTGLYGPADEVLQTPTHNMDGSVLAQDVRRRWA